MENRLEVTATIKRLEVLLARAGRAGAGGQAAALANWTAIQAVGANAQLPPHSQTGPVATNVAIIVVWPRFSGLFGVSVRASWSDGTTAGSVTHTLFTKQGASNGAISSAGTVTTEGKSGSFFGSQLGVAPSLAAVLGSDAAGAVGLLFEGSGAFTISQHADVAGTLLGLLSANGIGTQNFESGWMLGDATGNTSNVKTPFTLGKPVAFCLQVSATAAHLITYDSLSFFAQELPFT